VAGVFTPGSVLSAYSYGVVADSHRLPDHQIDSLKSFRMCNVKECVFRLKGKMLLELTPQPWMTKTCR
jgi:hypothetical protein